MIKIHNTSTGRGLNRPSEVGLDVSLLIDNMPEELSDNGNGAASFTIGKDYEEILDEDFLHEILFSDNQVLVDEIDVGSCDDEYHFLPMHEVLVNNADGDRPRNFVARYKISHYTLVDTNRHRLVLGFRSKGVSPRS